MSDEINATDAALKLAKVQGIDLAQVNGTGADGRVTKPDVEAYLAMAAKPAEPETEAPATPVGGTFTTPSAVQDMPPTVQQASDEHEPEWRVGQEPEDDTLADPEPVVEREHVTTGEPCWCGPDIIHPDQNYPGWRYPGQTDDAVVDESIAIIAALPSLQAVIAWPGDRETYAPELRARAKELLGHA